jgi:hypothetical protein
MVVRLTSALLPSCCVVLPLRSASLRGIKWPTTQVHGGCEGGLHTCRT